MVPPEPDNEAMVCAVLFRFSVPAFTIALPVAPHSAAPELTVTVPALSVKLPVLVFTPARVRVPEPVLVKPPAPLMTPL